MNRLGRPSQRVGVMLAFVCLAVAARGVLLGISSATVSATARGRHAADPFQQALLGLEFRGIRRRSGLMVTGRA